MLLTNIGYGLSALLGLGVILVGAPFLLAAAGGPVPGRGRGGVRAAIAAAEDLPGAISDEIVELIVRLRKELAGQRLDAGPDTICWHLRHHHRVKAAG